MGCDIADAYLNAELGSGYEWWYNFYEFHKLAIDELEAFDYEEYKKNGFKLEHIADYPLKLEKSLKNNLKKLGQVGRKMVDNFVKALENAEYKDYLSIPFWS